MLFTQVVRAGSMRWNLIACMSNPSHSQIALSGPTPLHACTLPWSISWLAVLQSLFNNLREAQARRDVKAIVITGANGATAAGPLRLAPLQPLATRSSPPVLLFV
jgi:hypothetical protein